MEFHVTFTGMLEGQLEGSSGVLWAIDNSGTAVGWAPVSDGMGGFINHAMRWTLETGLEDISSLDVPWFDLETNEFVDGWVFRKARDINEAGQMAGAAEDGISRRACVYDPLMGFLLLPRLTESPYDEALYSGRSSNEAGEVQGLIQPAITGYPSKTFLWTPTNPSTISVIEPVAERACPPGGIGSNLFCVLRLRP